MMLAGSTPQTGAHARSTGRYARGYGALWDAWLFQQQELAARVPYMVSESPGGQQQK